MGQELVGKAHRHGELLRELIEDPNNYHANGSTPVLEFTCSGFTTNKKMKIQC